MIQIASIGGAYSGSASEEQVSRPNGPEVPKKTASSLLEIASAMANDSNAVRRQLGQQLLLTVEQKKQETIDKRKANVEAKREQERIANPEGHRKASIGAMRMPQLKAILTALSISVVKLKVADMKQILMDNPHWDLEQLSLEGKLVVVHIHCN